jgi:thymidylate kinase
MKRGKFIVLYGINNLGKTTQAKLLVKNLKKNRYKAEYLKYPVYDLEPAGGLINGYLRKGNPYGFSAREFELLHFIDRIMFADTLDEKLKKGINVVAEDYFGTAVAWGTGAGVSRKLLEYLYSFVAKEDLSILFDGKRFIQSVEKNHKHENDNILMKKVRRIHLAVGKKYGWEKIDANLPIGEIEKIIWKKTEKIIAKKK